LICHGNHPSLILKTTPSGVEQDQDSRFIQGNQLPSGEDNVQEIIADAIAFGQDFKLHGRLQSLGKSISQFQAAVKLLPQGDQRLPETLHNLGVALQHRFGTFGQLGDIDNAIEQHQMAIRISSDDDADKPYRLCCLGNAFAHRFNRLGNPEDIDDAIVKQQEALDLTPDGHYTKSNILSNLGTCLQYRYERFGNRTDLDSAIERRQAAVTLMSDTDPDKALYRTNLGGSLYFRFERFGNIADLDNAIVQKEMAVNLVSDDYPNKPAYLSNLGVSLAEHFQRLGNIASLDRAIVQKQRAVDLTLDTHPLKSNFLSNLGTSLIIRFQCLGNLTDINDAISVYQTAVNLAPRIHPNKPSYLNDLCIALQLRFERSRNLDDINHAITYGQMAVHLTQNNHPSKSKYLGNLGNSLVARFKKLRTPVDMDQAIVAQQQAANLTPEDHPERVRHLNNLGNAFGARFTRFHRPEDAEQAIAHLSQAASSPFGSPVTRFETAEAWISFALLINHHSLLAAYECAIGLMPLVAWLGLPIADRHEHLVKIGGISREAAAAAISINRYDKALEWLEQGRSIVWTQILQLRTPVEQLRDADPVLADRLLQISQLLQRVSEQKDPLGVWEEEGRKYRALTEEWEAIVKQVRSLPNFENFLRPPRLSQLRKAAQNGPVVVVNIAKNRCDALAILEGLEEVINIPLPDISSKTIIELRKALKDHLYSNGIRMRDTRAIRDRPDEANEDACREVLARLWDKLVSPILESLSFYVRKYFSSVFHPTDDDMCSLIQTSFRGSGGVPLGRWHSFLYTQRGYMTRAQKSLGLVTMSYPHTPLLYLRYSNRSNPPVTRLLTSSQ
jgi:tetratricopeptide (TPR) repeat protein